MPFKDYYQVLGISKAATEAEIKTAYRKLARKYHPDISKEPQAEEKFKEVGEAYEVLKDPEKRAGYDQQAEDMARGYRHSASGAQHRGEGDEANFHAEDILNSIFGGRGGRGGRGQQQEFSYPGHDYNAEVSVSLEEAYAGTSKQFQVGGQTLQVKIPAGVREGQSIRLAGQGANGVGNAPKGDLYLKINLAKHALFDVISNDIYLTLAVTPWEAALGDSITIPTLSGKIDLKIPPNSQGGQKMRLKGRGLPGKSAGDQYVVLKIVTPPATTDAARDLYRKMAAEMPFNPREKLGV